MTTHQVAQPNKSDPDKGFYVPGHFLKAKFLGKIELTHKDHSIQECLRTVIMYSTQDLTCPQLFFISWGDRLCLLWSSSSGFLVSTKQFYFHIQNARAYLPLRQPRQLPRSSLLTVTCIASYLHFIEWTTTHTVRH